MGICLEFWFTWPVSRLSISVFFSGLRRGKNLVTMVPLSRLHIVCSLIPSPFTPNTFILAPHRLSGCSRWRLLLLPTAISLHFSTKIPTQSPLIDPLTPQYRPLWAYFKPKTTGFERSDEKLQLLLRIFQLELSKKNWGAKKKKNCLKRHLCTKKRCFGFFSTRVGSCRLHSYYALLEVLWLILYWKFAEIRQWLLEILLVSLQRNHKYWKC